MTVTKLGVLYGGLLNPRADYIDDVFGTHGFLSRRVEGYRPRPGQIALARAIDKGIREQRHVIGEGPTGTGKSLAYSVPAAYHAVHHKKRVLIVTSNKTLQAQIVNKDLKDLREAVPWRFTYAVRKGIPSYLCARDYRDAAWRDIEHEDPDMVGEVCDWADSTPTGDFEDSPGPSTKIWAAFSTTNDECDGPKSCSARSDCFVIKAKDAAAKADIVVTNYHLLFRHLDYVASGRPGAILPDFDIAILDEAHNAANIARDYLGENASVTFGSVHRCTTKLHLVDVSALKAKAFQVRHLVMDELRRFWAEMGKRAARGARVFEKAGDCATADLEACLAETMGIYLKAAELMGTGAARKGDVASYQAMAVRTGKTIDRLAAFREMKYGGLVYYLDGEGPQVKLRAKALHVGSFMHDNLFLPTPTVVQTSATLAVKGGSTTSSDFDYLKREMGMNKLVNVDELTVPSPFNWPKQALLVIPREMPEYEFGDPAFKLAVQDHFAKIVRIVKGRTMGLFTSYKLMEQVRDSLRAAKVPYNVLAQRDATNRELQQRFRHDVSSVLLGTQSFAEGVDIQGEACTCVVLDKINFISQKDPVLMGMARTDKHVFSNYQVPEAIISFKQRIGRLIRSIRDVGVVVVLDRRLLTKGYGRQFISSIPPMQVAHELSDIAPFLRSVGAL